MAGIVRSVSWSTVLADVQEVEAINPDEIQPESMPEFEERVTQIIKTTYDLAGLQRASSLPADLELDAKSFFERSKVFLRLKAPQRWGRGYGARSQMFLPQDIEVWRRILRGDWSLLLGDMDLLAFINHCYQHEFTSQVLDRLLDFVACVGEGELQDTIMGDAQLVPETPSQDLACQSHERSCDVERVAWSCRVCQSEGPHEDDFCCFCSTHRFEITVWRCRGVTRASTDRTTRAKSVPCGRIMRMLDAPFGVPCCSRCSGVRHRFPDEVFGQFSTDVEEPVAYAGEKGMPHCSEIAAKSEVVIWSESVEKQSGEKDAPVADAQERAGQGDCSGPSALAVDMHDVEVGEQSKSRTSSASKSFHNLQKKAAKWQRQMDAGKISEVELNGKILQSKVADRMRVIHGSEFREHEFVAGVLRRTLSP